MVLKLETYFQIEKKRSRKNLRAKEIFCVLNLSMLVTFFRYWTGCPKAFTVGSCVLFFLILFWNFTDSRHQRSAALFWMSENTAAPPYDFQFTFQWKLMITIALRNYKCSLLMGFSHFSLLRGNNCRLPWILSKIEKNVTSHPGNLSFCRLTVKRTSLYM